MNTPAHAAINLVLLGRGKDAPQLPIFIGSILPDAPMLLFYFLHKVLWHTPEIEIWRHAYYLPAWQNFFDLFNSLPLILVGLGLCWLLTWRWLRFLLLGMLVHVLLDLPLHHDDGHRHLYPLSDWRFQSPVSYWDPAHYGNVVGPIEIFLVMICCLILFRRYTHKTGRIAVGAFAGVYVGYLAYVLVVWA